MSNVVAYSPFKLVEALDSRGFLELFVSFLDSQPRLKIRFLTAQDIQSDNVLFIASLDAFCSASNISNSTKTEILNESIAGERNDG